MREYYYEPISGQTTWVLPTSTSPVKTGVVATKRNPASPMSITDFFAASPTYNNKVKDENINTKADGSYNKSGNQKRFIATTICAILLLNTLGLAVLVRVMHSYHEFNSHVPIPDSKYVPSADKFHLEMIDVDSSEVSNESTTAAPEGNEVEVIGSHQTEIEDEASIKESYVEKEAPVFDVSSSDNITSKILTTDKIISIINPLIPMLVGYGAARISIAVIARMTLMFSSPAAAIVVQVGPLAIIKKIFGRILGRQIPAVVVKPNLLQRIGNFFAKLLNTIK